MNKKILSILLVFTVFLRVVSQINPVLLQLRTDTAIKWNYFFGDEFNKGDIDDEKWHRGYPWGGLFVIEDEWADPAFLKFNPNGILEFNADKSNELRKFPDWMIDTNQLKKHGKKLVDGKYQLKYKGSAIWSKEPIKYGYFECRCKMPPGKGLWPAFWLYGGNPNDEIDFMELKGEKPKEIHIDVHCPDNCDKGYPGFMGIKKNWGAWAKVNSDLTKDWNIVSGIWMPGYVMFFLNGQVLACFKGDFKNSMNVIANLAIAVDNGPFGPGINDKTPLPAKMEVDYIRVWKVPEDVAFAERRIRIADPDLSPKNNKVTFGDLPKFKKVKRFMKVKKEMQKELGFLSFYPSGDKKIMVTNNTGIENNIQIKVKNNKGSVIKEQSIKGIYNQLDFSELSGKQEIEVNYLNRKTTFNIDLP